MAYTTRKLLASTALALTLSTSAAVADEFRIDRLFVIGDSLSDGGAYSNFGRGTTQQRIEGLTNAGQPVPAALTEARDNNIRYKFLNNAPDGSSQVYAEVVAEGLGITLEPNVITGDATPLGGNNYAQGGARVVIENTNPVLLRNGVTQKTSRAQIDSLLAANPSFGGNDLVIYWTGANDVTTNEEEIRNDGELKSDAIADVELAARQAVAQVEELIAAGATNLVVVTVPDVGTSTPLGQSPGTAANATDLSDLSRAYNDILVDGVAGRATVVNAGEVIDDVLRDPTRYGFSDTAHLDLSQTSCVTGATTPSAVQCVEGGSTRPGITPVFADDRHPTALAHRVLGEMALSALVAIGQAGVIPVATISGLRQQSLGLEQRLNLGAFFINDDNGKRIRRPVGSVEIYGGGEVGFYESDAQQVVPGFDATTQVLKVAADVMVTDDVMLGVGGSIDHGQIEYADGKGGFDSRLYVGGVFGVAQIIPGVYVNGFLGGGLIDVYDIDRNFNTTDLAGTVTSSNRYSADTDGTYFIARTNVGAVLPVGNGFAVNPSVGFAFEKVDIDGYNESARGGAPGALAARVGDLEYEGHRGTIALAGFYRPPSDPTWTFGLRASYEHDFNDDNVEVPFAVGTSPTNVQVAPRPDDSYGLLSATVVKELTHSTSLSLMGSTNFMQDGVDGYTASLVFKHSF